MVFIKASLGQELRKFSIESGTTIESLRTTVKGLFPALSEVDVNNLVVLYRDSDEDLITVSSDQELQAALSSLGDSDTLRVILRVLQRKPSRKEEEEEEEMEGTIFGDLFQSLFDPTPFPHHHFHHHHGSLFDFGGPSWFGRQHALRLHEEKIRQQRLYEEKMRQARLEQMIAMREKAAKEQEELKKKMKEERRKSTDLQTTTGEGHHPALIPQFPSGWKVNPFGSWDPLVEEGPHFTRKSWGPYGYVAYFNPSEEEKKEEEEGKEEEKKTEENATTEMEATPTEQ